jgi:hypothetical protein
MRREVAAMTTKLSERTLRKAQWLVADGRVARLADDTWAVEASTLHVGSYLVTRAPWGGLECECKGYHYRRTCSHVKAVALVLGEDDPLRYFEDEGDDSHVCRGCGCWLSDPKGLCTACATPKADVPSDPWARLR